MHPLKQKINDLRKYHEALGTKLASLERHIEADEVLKAPTMDRQPAYTVSSDGSVMHEGKRYSFLYKGIAIENVLIQEVKSNSIGTDGGDYVVKYIYHVREVKEPAKEWEIMEFYSVEYKRVHCKLSYKTGLYYSDIVESDFALSHMLYELKEGQITIHAVRRLSDGTVWRVGTITTNGRITGFEIKDINMMVSMDNGYSYPISLLTEAKALFTTADGVQVFDKNQLMYCFTDSGLINKWPLRDIQGDYKYGFYSTREAAQAAYDKWLFEQPVLTLNDIVQDGFPLEYLETMKQIVKEKIGKK